ncbi:hypothetical protein AOX55_00001096 [Sinorhizobium fredii CCBAU 25509]|nr:hypothetical protein SF83666_c08670 [Sinorhizobium fredii CCBAU 83666]AWM24372.1 hypothetical protein AOX55_00001096 [Sinorhizobium fredii CCBAU 25509]
MENALRPLAYTPGCRDEILPGNYPESMIRREHPSFDSAI